MGATETLEFCLRKLQWPELRAVLEEHARTGSDFRTRDRRSRSWRYSRSSGLVARSIACTGIDAEDTQLVVSTTALIAGMSVPSGLRRRRASMGRSLLSFH